MEIIKEVIEEELQSLDEVTRKPGDVWQNAKGVWAGKSQANRIAYFSNRKNAEDHARSADSKYKSLFKKSDLRKMYKSGDMPEPKKFKMEVSKADKEDKDAEKRKKI